MLKRLETLSNNGTVLTFVTLTPVARTLVASWEKTPREYLTIYSHYLARWLLVNDLSSWYLAMVSSMLREHAR